MADDIVSKTDMSAFKVPMEKDDFVWGSNAVVGNYAVITSYAFYLTEEEQYIETTAMITDYLFGKNCTGYSFMTGYGDKTPMKIHHRQSKADGVNDPVPGFIAGGPQSSNNPEEDLSYPTAITAKCYKDVWESYSTNEIAINWNAPAVFVLSVLESNQEGSVSIKSDCCVFNYRVGEFMRVAPTPFENVAKVIFNLSGDNLKFNVYDSDEKVVLSKNIDAKERSVTFDLSSYENGIYYFEVLDGANRVALERSVKID